MNGDIQDKFKCWIKKNCREAFVLGTITLNEAWRRFVKTNVVSWCEMVSMPKQLSDDAIKWSCPTCGKRDVSEQLCNSNRMIAVSYFPQEDWARARASNYEQWTYIGFSCNACGYVLTNEEEMIVINESEE